MKKHQKSESDILEEAENEQCLCSNFVCCANALVCWTFSPALVARAPGTGSALARVLSQEKRFTKV